MLDVFWPLEMFGALPNDYRLVTLTKEPGQVDSAQGPKAVADIALAEAASCDMLLVPGGRGTRREVDNSKLIAWLRGHAADCEIVATVCTGAALLARTGLLDGRRATTNKASFDWVRTQGPAVEWRARARWVADGKYWTSSGVSAGMDMALALIAHLDGADAAQRVATYTEYRSNVDPDDDPFSALYGHKAAAGDT
jgi:transcriptional regulator GlxA family with amidase domain